MHFFYGVGAFITPTVVQWFLDSSFNIRKTTSSYNCYSIKDVEEYMRKHPFSNAESAGSAIINQTRITEDEAISAILLKSTNFDSTTKYAFWILSIIQLPAPIILALSKFSSSEKFNSINIHADEASNETTTTTSNAETLDGYENIDVADNSKLQVTISYFKSIFRSAATFQMVLLISILVFLFEGLQVTNNHILFFRSIKKLQILNKNNSLKIYL